MLRLPVEVRARQRTFDGAYGRSALSNLGYALTVLRLFDERFHRSKPARSRHSYILTLLDL